MKKNSITVDKQFCARLNDLILKRHLNRSSVAISAKVSHRIIYKMLTEGETIRRVTLVKVAEALGVTEDYLETGKEPETLEPTVKQTEARPVSSAYVREKKTPYGDGIDTRDMTITDAIAVIARQTGTSEDEVRKLVAQLMMNGGK